MSKVEGYLFSIDLDTEEFEDTKRVRRIRKSKDTQRNGQKKKDNGTNNDLRNITQNTKDRVTRTTLNTASELMCPGRVGSSYSTSGTRFPGILILG